MIPSKFESILKSRVGNAYKKGRGRNGIEFRICCPFCLKRYGKADRGYKLSLNPVLNVAHCFRCGYASLATQIFGVKNDRSGDEAFAKVQAVARRSEAPGELLRLSDLPDNHACCNYIRGRGFSVQALDKYYGVMYCRKGKKFAGGIYDTSNTVVFPVWMNGKLAGWQSRLMYNPDSIPDSECGMMGFMQDGDGKYIRPPKYFTDPAMRKGECLYNFDLAKKSELVVICEGTMDAMAVGPCAVATFGKGVSIEQAHLIQDNWKLAAILLDPGDAELEMRKLQGLIECIPSFVVDLKGYKDAGEAPSEEIWNQIYAAAAAAGHDLMDYRIEIEKEALKP